MSLLLIFCTVSNIYAQNLGGCDTADPDLETITRLPWYDNENFLPQFRSEFESERSGQTYIVPIQFIVILEEGETLEQAMPNDFSLMMNDLNSGFARNNIPIQFQKICVKTVVRSSAFISNFEARLLVNNHRKYGAVNILIRENTENQAPVTFPFVAGDYMILPRATDKTLIRATDITHEMGHFFGLQHTHFGYHKTSVTCLQEDVRRDAYVYKPTKCNIFSASIKNCKIKGDLFCDTPADPSYNTGITTDHNGETFIPDKDNYMSYWDNTLYQVFSPSQQSAILHNFKVRLYHPLYYLNLLPLMTIPQDVYENDNSALTSRAIKIGETQNRTLLDGNGCEYDPVDFIYLDLSDNRDKIIGNYVFEVSDLNGTINPVAQVKAFVSYADDHSVANKNKELEGIIKTNDDKTITIPCNKLPSNAKFLIFQVIKASGLSGIYKAKMIKNPSMKIIPDASTYCFGSTTFELEGVPANATYQWTGPGLQLSNYNNPAPTMVLGTSGAPSGLKILSATVTQGECFEYVTKDLTGKLAINQALPSISNPNINISIKDCYNFKGRLTVDVVGAVSYTINSITPPNQPSVSIIKSPYGNFYDISGTFVPLTSSPQYNSTTFAGEIIATNSCGATATLPFTHTVSKPSCGKGKDDVELFPNPADDFVNIKITPKDDEGFELERKIIIQSINEGQKFEKITTEKELQIELGEFENGLYFIQVFRIGEEEPSTATLSILRR